MRWERGATATHTADFLDEDGQIVALSGLPTVVVLDPDDVEFVSGPSVLGAFGVYSFSWDVPVDADLGMWKIEWTATTTTAVTLTGNEWFEVVEEGASLLAENVRHLRNLVDRRLPGMSDLDTFFTDDEIHSLLAKNGADVWLAAYEAWLIKAGVYADLIDITEGGTSRKFSQRHRNAMSMVEYFRKQIKEVSDAHASVSNRVVGKVFSLRNDPHDVFGIYTIAGISTSGLPYNVRTYTFFAGSGTLEEMQQRALSPTWYGS